MNHDQVVLELQSIVGEEHVSTSADDRAKYGQDALKEIALPEVVVWPRTADEIAAVMRLANRDRIPVTPRAGGVGYTGGAVPLHGGILLSVTRMNRILEIDEPNLVAIAEPGVITADFQRAVEAKGLFFPPDPSSLEESMLGGNIAENAGGPRCVKYGVTGAYVLGMTFVTATGEIVKAGGRTTKNVVGFDLTSLMVGSEGMLGIATDITFRLLPLPEANRTVSVIFATARTAAACVTAIMANRIIPAKLELIDGFSLRAVADYTGEPLPENAGALLLIEVDGSPGEVEREAREVERICREIGAIEIVVAETAEESERLWSVRRKMSPAVGRLRPRKLNQDVVVPRTRIPDLLEIVDEISARLDLLIPCFGHAGDGNMHVNVMIDPDDLDEARRGKQAVEEIFRAAVALGGTISGEHGIGYVKAPYLGLALTPDTIDCMRRLKRMFDPNGILNPGKVFFD
ncbi:MAG: FAD-linked oxidase C-terminal domain-containing protein [Blastocatellia bacterium]